MSKAAHRIFVRFAGLRLIQLTSTAYAWNLKGTEIVLIICILRLMLGFWKGI